MSDSDFFQYVPPDRLKIYRNGAVIGAGKQYKLNFSTNFTITEDAINKEYDIDVGAATDANAAHVNSNNAFGAFYEDLSQIAAPANPSAGTRRIYVDSGTGKLSVRTSAGTSVSLEEQSAGAREDLCAQFGWNGQDSVSSSYVDSLWLHTTISGSSVSGTKAITPIDFTGKTQFKVAMGIVINGTGTFKAKVVDDSTTTNTLVEFTGLTTSSTTQVSSIASLPGWATGAGVKTLRMQVAGPGTSDDIGIPHCSIYLK